LVDEPGEEQIESDAFDKGKTKVSANTSSIVEIIYAYPGNYLPWRHSILTNQINSFIMSIMELLCKEQISDALTRLNSYLGSQDVHSQLYIVGGTVMCLVYEARPATKDVDAWFTEASIVRKIAAQVADELGLPTDWLNDAAKAFIPDKAQFELWQSLSHLDILVADARTLLAMKCAAARTKEDVADIKFLANHLGLYSAQAILDVVLAYYPLERLTIRVQLLLEELFNDGP
jgi:hypothetical protein